MIPPVLLLGFGRMGAALAAGWRENGLAPSFAVDPGASSADNVTCVATPALLPADFIPEAVILAVKPQMAHATVPSLARFAGASVFLSIMAGCRVEVLASLLGSQAAIVRAMPNTPASIRRGITVAHANAMASPAQRQLCDQLLRAVGTVAWTDDESQLDAVTAISGSGPAYVFLLAELLEQEGRRQGLPDDLARALARETISGAGAMLATTGEDAAELRRGVTSKNGTTERALAVLLAEWPAPLTRAIDAAAARSRELSGPSS